MPKVELNLEDDELKELLLGDRDKAMQSIMAKILDEILKSEATEQISIMVIFQRNCSNAISVVNRLLI